MKTIIRLGIITLLIAVLFGFALVMSALVSWLVTINTILACFITVIGIGLFITFISSDMVTDFFNRHM